MHGKKMELVAEELDLSITNRNWLKSSEASKILAKIF